MGPAEDHCPSSRLESLPARPPTPPRETLSHDLDPPSNQLYAPQQLVGHQPSLQTPPGLLSPTASSGLPTARRRRVYFSSQAHYQDPPIYTDPPSRRQQQTPVSLPPSNSRPAKGILKQTSIPNKLSPPDGVYLDADKPEQVIIADMLESTLQQLAGADRESKIDAYIMLFRGLKGSSNLPDRIALQAKMGLFMQFIQRDISFKPSTDGHDKLLVTSALKLLHAFLGFPGIASSIPTESGIFLVDHCVRSFEDDHAPKEVITHLMQALHLQNFSFEVMTFERVGRLVISLHDVENHLSGKSVIQGRIRVYEKLVKQCPQQMAVHSDWLQDLFTDMLSSASGIRSDAMRFGLSAAYTLNKDTRLLNRVLALLDLALEDKKYVDHITERLEAMLRKKEESALVPRIWSVITLLIPNPNEWGGFHSWLNVVKGAFNQSSLQTKKEASLAWSRFTYRLFLDNRLDRNRVLCLIRDPLLSLLKQRAVRDPIFRDSILGAIRNLYYYVFRPDVHLRVLNNAWDVAVAPLVKQLIANGQKDSTYMLQAAAILTGLVDCRTRTYWRQDRISDTNLVRADELPAIDSKWIRANSERLFDLVGPVLTTGFTEVAVASSPFHNLWRALVHSVASASTKDVKLHDDTAKFVAKAFTLLLDVWKQGPINRMHDNLGTPSEFLDAVKEYILTLIEGLGLLPNPFTDKPFCRTKEDVFVVQTTASHRLGKSQGPKRTPLHHLFYFLSNLPTGVPDDSNITLFFENIFSPFFEGKNERSKAALAQEFLRLLPVDVRLPYGIWAMCAAKIAAPLEHSQLNYPGSNSSNTGNLGPEYRDIVKFLERGLRSCSNLPWGHWTEVFRALVSRVRNEVGDAGVAVAVVEPLAGTVKDIVSSEETDLIHSNHFDAAVDLLGASSHPRDKQAVDAARRRLWGTTGSRQSSFDPFDNLYKLTAMVLEKLYSGIGAYESEHLIQMLDELGNFFDRGNTHLRLRSLTAIQPGLVSWIEDKEHRITETDFPGVAEALYSLCPKLYNILIEVSPCNLQLNAVESLFCAAFQSTHRGIVTIAARAWNLIYKTAEHIEYPETLKAVLASLGSSVDLTRPGIELADTSFDYHRFTESQELFNPVHIATPARVRSTAQSRSSASRRSATPGSILGTEQVTSSARGIGLAATGSRGATPRQKLRHEDSQLQFAAIDTSPSGAAQESQLLTDRQKEIRERQRETAAMFPEMRSSPTEKTKKAREINQLQPSGDTALNRASTPDHERDFEDCLTSTPTPRRGQAVSLPIEAQEMTDPPSSPPEPRSFCLLAEIKSKTRNTTSLDDWQFSSSPVSGSPNQAVQAILASQPMELDDVDEELRLDEGVVVEKDENTQLTTRDVVLSQPATDDVVEDTTFFGQEEQRQAAPTSGQSVAHGVDTTPSGRYLRSSEIQITPRSDNDEFVDAPSSPVPATISQAAVGRDPPATTTQRLPSSKSTQNQSFGVSASFENGMRDIGTGRLEITLRSSQHGSPRRQEHTPYNDVLPESPEHALELQQREQAGDKQRAVEVSGAWDSIEVAGEEIEKPKRGRPKKNRRATAPDDSQSSQPSEHSQSSLNILIPRGPQASALSTPIGQVARPESQDSFENVSPGSGMWWRKRKRSVSSSIYDSGGSKKACHADVLASDVIQEEVPDSQPAVVANEGQAILHDSGSIMLPHEPNPETRAIEELYEKDISFATNETSSPVKQQASRELGLTIDDRTEDTFQKAVDEPEPQATDEPEASAQVEILGEQMENSEDEMDDDEAVHSQLVREEQEVESRRASRATSPVHYSAEPAKRWPPAAEVIEEQEPSQNLAGETHQTEPEPSKFAGLMNVFRNGLAMLRSVDLSREQFYEAEDVFFEMRQELFEAQRRGGGR